MKLDVIVPCYNEEGTIEEVLQRLLNLSLPCGMDIIVVDDGSTDSSPDIVEKFPNVQLIRHEVNKGKGAAMQTGAERSSSEMVLAQDADLEYFPEDIPKLIQPILSGQADVVLGSRFLSKPQGMSLSHLFGNKFLSFVASVLFGKEITDLMTGYKLFTRKAFLDIGVRAKSFEVEAELVAKALKQGLRLVEVPIGYEYRKKGKAKITWKHGVRSLWTLLRIKFNDA